MRRPVSAHVRAAAPPMLQVTRDSWVVQAAWAVAAVAVATAVIAFVLSFTRISNISLLYLPVVLWLAARYGRGPAILASILSFLSYDWFFIPPVHKFTVDNPPEWLSLFALLAVSLALGQVTAMVRARAQEAEESREQTATLYRVAQLIVASDDEASLLTSLSREIVTLFGASGVLGCALLLPDDAAATKTAVQYTTTADEALAHTLAGDETGPYLLLRRSLVAARGEVGQLLVAGLPTIHQLAPEASAEAVHAGEGEQQASGAPDGRQAVIFAAVCDQIALALDHAALAREAAHVAALRESDRLKDILLGSVTHDLRTPLASIKAVTTSLLQEDVEWTPQERRELVESMDASANRLNRLVGNLLDLSRLEAGVARPEFDWCLMSDVVATVLDRLDLTGQARRHPVQVKEPPDMPLTLMDYTQIEQVLTNLLENAFKYSPEGSDIQVRVTPREQELEVAVIDHGIGIPLREREAVFDKFYRVQQTQFALPGSRPPTGTGLGLAICANIVHAHSGRIWVEDTPGGGATLLFTLPLAPEPPAGALPELNVRAPNETRQEAGA